MAEESSTKAPVLLPTYALGDEGKPNHFTASTTRETAAIEAKSLSVNDAAFIKRSDLKWTYAIVTEKVESGVDADGKTILRFEVDKDKNRKSFPENQWGKYIRVIKAEDDELAKLKAEEDAAKTTVEEEASKPAVEEEVEVQAEEEPKEEEEEAADIETSTSAGGESTASNKSNKSSSSWFGSMFGGASKKDEKNIPAAVPEEEEDATDDQPATTAESMDTPAPFTAAELTSSATPLAPIDTSALSVVRAPSQGSFAVETPIERHAAVAEHVKEVESKQEDQASVAAAPALTVDTPSDAPTEAARRGQEEQPVDNTKENSDPSDDTEPAILPSPKSSDSVQASKAATEPAPATEMDKVSSLRSPLGGLKQPVGLKKKSSIIKFFGKAKNKLDTSSPTTTERKVVVTSPKSAAANAAALGADPKSPKNAVPENKKEWFDPEACEVDYDKNATDLFQALEARQFDYVDQMFSQVNRQFTKECRTWVVARGQKRKDSSQLRFRALPLHAALVFGAPDCITKKILNAYPKGTRGRDVKGRLPIHLAMEHDASEEIVALVLEAFPKGFFARDKKDMEPIDYINGNTERSYMKKYIPLITDARVEEERVVWEAELESALEVQKVALKTDPVYMEDVIESITENVETNCATKMEMLEMNYKKEILLLKKKHDSETQALLEGFEVKLNFERKLLKLKSTKA
mmetsp:Transcript_5337/g.12121  ORF Transcript_5337/g.12121 Transcript_5337/m.12121 type:complete len:693 (-) Transcript_5337:204-2282(-)|eukprot:CAMPEP_0172316164 /NCGR_PEP_ID=MMETSP1058-20130122/27488_1 /TAXON_ID=83371 /ORGANISM="Detonula confervacea, Strain CCMP 353" /LENGTH=692 /DNA_ID=CAMNT_0013030421 /DNA_START=68 /DNA_END=2146 /DNA_ORIENTATION=+